LSESRAMARLAPPGAPAERAGAATRVIA